MPVDFGLQLQSFPYDSSDTDLISFYRQMVAVLPPQFTTLWVSDHLQFGDSPTLEGWTRLTYLAALFPHLKVGHLVLGQGYRNPALLAKMGATLQHLTGGRFILGIGAGWAEEEYRAYGYGYPSRKDRLEQLAEALQIIRAMWTSSPATFHGTHYQIESAWCVPQPNPVPPIMVGSPGPKVMRITARYADGWSWDAPMETWNPPFRELMDACAEIDRDPADIWITAAANADFPVDQMTFQAGYTHSYYPEINFPVLGPTPEAAVEQLRPVIEAGARHIMLFPETMRTLELFCQEAVPELLKIEPGTPKRSM
jgi:alkanesulfonate monooxygenase SsuD/methylene tetrahydromethanopterin reductase-like flavin-dependent oxidoreductase (luciferase family)